MATIKDIAKAAGVSVTTVSRALNGYSDVNEKTRERIKQIAQELQYSPNTLARSLVMNKTKTIGLLVSGMTRGSIKDNFTYEILCGINDTTSSLDYDLIFFSTNTSKQKEKSYTQLCRERKVDGVIIQGIKTDDPYLREVIDSDIPCVLIDIPIEGASVGYITTDNVLGAKNAVKHLLQLGHKHIGMINGHNQAFVSQQRLEGYRLGLIEDNIDFNWNYVVNGAFDEDQAYLVSKKLLQTNPQLTAIFSASDVMALGVLRAAKELNRSIPDDLSLVGYDDIVLASYVSPPLTTIAQDKYLMGQKAAELLVAMLQGGIEERRIVIDTVLVERSSTTKVN
ncbi:MAG: LacI family DNA-binding transcriptional regulator [Anaerobacillus sp.]|uniref:LacI family DNA-binding transcriptional regulator n=1 Tax=Anaerobacillus sp. TaxID=1872506 RepID=UPI00391DFD71